MRLARSAALAATLLAGSITLAAPAPRIEAQLPGRLPTEVVPIHYDIMIDPDATALTFTGQETVTISVARPTTTIVLNAAELAIGGVRLDGATVPTRVATDEAAQTLTIGFATPITAGTHKLAISFSGKINQSAAGLFATDYKDASGDHRMLVTQFEPADGRRFAPLWDEPGRKATFTLSAVTPKGQTSFSNMPVAKTEKLADGETLVTFKPTPKMSSYLLFLGQGEVERKSRMVGATEIGVITRKGALDQADYALDAAAKILPYFNDYFGQPYPLPKLDMIAAPGSSQFFSAMENWGAILYFDRAVLVDPKLSTESNRQDIFNVVAHEMAHQWFGDLVTMSWWDDLWLNEGFASWMAGKVTGELNPTWNIAAQDTAFARQSAFTVDAVASTHPIVQRIATPDQVSQAFDTITYQKGQAVIRMLEGSVGADPFRAGVRAYMERHKYQNTVTDDLWRAISASAGRPVKPFMDTFTLQEGVPLIRAAEPACAGGRTRIALSQARFGLDAESKVAQRWIVPVDLAAGAARAKVDVSGAAAKPATVPGCGLAVVNPGQLGYYRTAYAPRHAAALARGFATLGLSDQVGLMGDSLALANSGDAPLDRYLALVGQIPADADPLVWDYAAQQLRALDGRLEGDPAQAAYRAKVRRLLSPQFDRVTFKPVAGEAPALAQLRETLIVVLGRIGDPAVVEGAQKLAAGDEDDIPAAIREPVLAAAAYTATPAQWERARARAKAEKNPNATRAAYGRLGHVADPVLAQRALDLALTEEATVPNRSAIIAAVAVAHPELAFDWAAAHDTQVNALVEASAKPRFLVGLAGGSADPALADRVAAYAQAKLPAASRQGADTAIASIRTRARLKREQAAPLARWATAR